MQGWRSAPRHGEALPSPVPTPLPSHSLARLLEVLLEPGSLSALLSPATRLSLLAGRCWVHWEVRSMEMGSKALKCHSPNPQHACPKTHPQLPPREELGKEQRVQG